MVSKYESLIFTDVLFISNKTIQYLAKLGDTSSNAIKLYFLHEVKEREFYFLCFRNLSLVRYVWPTIH